MSQSKYSQDVVVAAIDVGAPRNIGWAILSGGDVTTGGDLDEFIECFAKHSEGRHAALGFEAPLFIPHGRPLQKLTAQRDGDNGKPWSAGAGATVTTIGLAIVSHVLRNLHERQPDRRATQDWKNWLNGNDLLFFEAFVSGDNHAGPGEHWKDALNAAEGFKASLADLDNANAVHEGNVLSLLGACMLRTGWSNDLSTLSQPCLVIRP